jgi:hypothetical protein
MYSESLNEILACLVCIINVVRFEFLIQPLFLFFQSKSFDTSFVTQNSCKQVCPTKLSFVKIKSRDNFGEFLRLFLEGLNAFQIHRRFKFELVPKLT